jgi:hypothetical protein
MLLGRGRRNLKIRRKNFMSLQSIQFRGDPALEACLTKDSAHIIPGHTGVHVGKIQTALITLDSASIETSELSGKLYGSSTASAVLKYKQRRRIINPRYQATADNIVGKMTIAALDNELVTSRSANPKTAANEAKPLALKWVSNAIFVLNARIRSLGNRFGPSNLALVSFPQIRIHFHIDRLKSGATEAVSLQRLESNYQKIKIQLLNSDPIFRSVDDATAARETAGQFRPGVILGAYTFPLKSVSFTSHFLSLGPNAKAATILHELGHFISPSIGHIGGESGPAYDNSNFETAINNSHCYPNFATHVTPPFRDERFGLSRPTV